MLRPPKCPRATHGLGTCVQRAVFHRLSPAVEATTTLPTWGNSAFIRTFQVTGPVFYGGGKKLPLKQQKWRVTHQNQGIELSKWRPFTTKNVARAMKSLSSLRNIKCTPKRNPDSVLDLLLGAFDEFQGITSLSFLEQYLENYQIRCQWNDIIQSKISGNFHNFRIIMDYPIFLGKSLGFFIAHLKWSCLLRGRLGDTKVETSQVLQGSMALHGHGDALRRPTGPTAVGLGWEMNPVSWSKNGELDGIGQSPKCIQVHHDSSWSMIWVLDWSWFIDGKSSWLWWIGHQTRSGPSNCRVRRVPWTGKAGDSWMASHSSTEDFLLLRIPAICWLRTYTWSILNQCCSHCCLSGRLVGPFQSKFWSICFQRALLFCGPY